MCESVRVWICLDVIVHSPSIPGSNRKLMSPLRVLANKNLLLADARDSLTLYPRFALRIALVLLAITLTFWTRNEKITARTCLYQTKKSLSISYIQLIPLISSDTS